MNLGSNSEYKGAGDNDLENENETIMITRCIN